MTRSRSIRRRSYVRRTTSGRRVRVAASRIPDRGLPGRGPQILPLPERGALGRWGYHNIKRLTEEKRHQILRQAIREHGYRKTIGHLTLLANYTHRTDPAVYALFKRDQEWVSRQYVDFKARHGPEVYKSKAAKKREQRSRLR